MQTASTRRITFLALHLVAANIPILALRRAAPVLETAVFVQGVRSLCQLPGTATGDVETPVLLLQQLLHNLRIPVTSGSQ